MPWDESRASRLCAGGLSLHTCPLTTAVMYVKANADATREHHFATINNYVLRA